MVRDALGRVLSEEADFEIVASARSVDACLKHLAQNEGKIDVAVIDVRLTDGVGHDITRWIRANCATAVLSARSGNRTRKKLPSGGFKPPASASSAIRAGTYLGYARRRLL